MLKFEGFISEVGPNISKFCNIVCHTYTEGRVPGQAGLEYLFPKNTPSPRLAYNTPIHRIA